ncbi:MAG: response regulator [Candidatus Saccharimonadales bacterium]
MHILIVEPDKILQDSYKDMLLAGRYTVDGAFTAEQAIGCADKTRPNVVVLNSALARHNGVEFLYEFKSYSDWQDIPIIVLAPELGYESFEKALSGFKTGNIRVLVQSKTTLRQLSENIASMVGEQT